MVSILNYYTTKFGELWNKSLYDLVHEAIHGVLKETGIDISEISAGFYGNMLGGILENNLLLKPLFFSGIFVTPEKLFSASRWIPCRIYNSRVHIHQLQPF